MYGYRIIKNNNAYHFELLPSNNHAQCMGRSCDYNDEAECRKGLQDFHVFVKLEGLSEEKDGKVTILKDGRWKCYFEYIKDGRVIFWCHKPYNGGNALNSCHKGIESIYKNIDDYCTNELDYI